MNTPTTDLCASCFVPLAGGRPPCGACGFQGSEPAPRKEGELALGALLRERYAIGRVLGRGGFGITYLAWDTRLRRRRAIKEYFPRGVVTREVTHAAVSVVSGQTQLYTAGMEKYLEEARLLAQFEDHPCIVSPLDFFEENQTAYLVMEYLEGETLRSYVARSGGRISYETALHVLLPVVEALATVHRAGILHRDVSPDNIFLTVKGEAKLLDFGAARQRLADSSASMTVILREHYAPPEQYTKSGRQGSWTDVYAFAATFYMAITGHSPPPAPERLMQDRIEWPSRLGVAMPALAEQALMGALAVRIEERPQHIEELKLSLAGKRLGPSGSVQDPIRSLRTALWAGLAQVTRAAWQAGALLVPLITPARVRAVLLAVGLGVVGGASAAGLWRWMASGPAETAGVEQADSTPSGELPEPAPGGNGSIAQTEARRQLTQQQLPEPPAPVVPTVPVAPDRLGLIVRSAVSDDQLFIDDELVGSTGSTFHGLPAGTHRVRVVKEGYQPFEADVEIAAGKGVATLFADLKRSKPKPSGEGSRETFDAAQRALAAPDSDAWNAALAQLRQLADAGYGPAQGELGLVLGEGRGKVIPVDEAASLDWLRKAAEKGDPPGQYLLGLRLEFGRMPPGARNAKPQTPFERAGLFKRLVGGDADFLTRLRTYTTATSDAQLLAQAFGWYRKAAERGHAGAQERAAYMFASGRGTKQTANEAFYWLLKAAVAGRIEAQYAIGMSYLLGEGYEANPEAAACWLREAARAGHEGARTQIARIKLGEDPGPSKSELRCNFAPLTAN